MIVLLGRFFDENAKARARQMLDATRQNGGALELRNGRPPRHPESLGCDGEHSQILYRVGGFKYFFKCSSLFGEYSQASNIMRQKPHPCKFGAFN